MSKRAVDLWVICETPVTPPSDTLQEKWTLEMGGIWGYVFNYSAT